MTLFYSFLMAFFLVSHPTFAADGSGHGGVGNGGVALICGNQISLPEENKNIRWLWEDDRYANHPDLIREEVLNRLNLLGSGLGIIWENVLDKSLLDAHLWDSLTGIRTHDINFPIPAGCRVVQVGFNYQGKVYRVLPDFNLLSASQIHLLSYHEKLYSYAIDVLGHDNAILTRQLEISLLTLNPSPSEIKDAIAAWVNFRRTNVFHYDGRHFRIPHVKKSFTKFLRGAYESVQSSESCPSRVILLSNDELNAAIYWVDTNSKKVHEGEIVAGGKNNCNKKTTDQGLECQFFGVDTDGISFLGKGIFALSDYSHFTAAFSSAPSCTYKQILDGTRLRSQVEGLYLNETIGPAPSKAEE